MDLAFTRRRFISALSSMLASLRLLRYRAFSKIRAGHKTTSLRCKNTSARILKQSGLKTLRNSGRMHCPWAMDAWEQWCLALSIHWRRELLASHCLPAHEGLSRVLARLDHRRWSRWSHDLPVVLDGE